MNIYIQCNESRVLYQHISTFVIAEYNETKWVGYAKTTQYKILYTLYTIKHFLKIVVFQEKFTL